MEKTYIVQPRNRSFFSFPGLSEALYDEVTIKFCETALIENVKITGNSWEIFVNTPSLAALSVLYTLEGILLKVVPHLKKVRIRLGRPLPLNQEELARIWPDFLNFLAKANPPLQSLLVEAGWELKGDGLVFLMPHDTGVELLKKKKFEELLNGELERIFDKKVFVSYRVEPSRLKKPEPQEVHEFPIIPQATEAGGAKSGKTGARKTPAKGARDGGMLYGRKITGQAVPLRDIDQYEGQSVVIAGEVVNLEKRELRNGRVLISVDLYDGTDTLTVKVFDDNLDLYKKLLPEQYLEVQGKVQEDRYSRDLVLTANHIRRSEPKQVRIDNHPEKRIELHLHTKISAMDSTVELEDIMKTAQKWGHPALAITDHGVVQAFPAAAKLGKKYGVKVIYGMEGYLADGDVTIVQNADERDLDETVWVVFDVETTGLRPYRDELIEIGAVKVRGEEVVERFSELIKPQRPIPPEIQKLTGITPSMVENAPQAAEVLERFLAFCRGAVLAAHNAPFDTAFIREGISAHLAGREYNFPVLDTLPLAKVVWPGFKNYKLNTIAGELNISLENHHRAVEDAACAAEILLRALKKLKTNGVQSLQSLNQIGSKAAPELQNTYHILILVQNQTGLKNLYKIVSESHLRYFHRNPKIPRDFLVQHRQGLLFGSACEAGELYRALLDEVPEDRLAEIASFYDFLEVHPLENNEFLVRQGKVTRDDLININKKIVALGEKLNIPVIGSSDVHFIKPEDEVFRRILLAGQGFEDAENQAPLYYRTTEEMLEAYDYLGPQKARELVIDNPRKISELIENVKPVPDEFYPPQIEGADEEIRKMAYAKARERYGEPLPEIVESRLELELKSIIGHGYAVLYLIAHKLVKKSNDDGYLVGSRGSVGSSFVATMCGITEVNPLPPHYLCPDCRYAEFVNGHHGSGFDLPPAQCARCGKDLIREGHNIPFATFMGFEGDKEPDIDLNFSGEYQGIIHKYTEELFGKDYVYRAGTITSLADKTAYGFVRGYMQDKGLKLRNAEINRLVKGCSGVRRSTGQHPGGMVVVPKDQEIYNFTPIQYPANDKEAGQITTHFDFHSALEGRLVKLDILGHDDPTMLKMLQDLTGIEQASVPITDPQVMKLFTSASPLGLSGDQLEYDLGTLAIPEFGTEFVRQMLLDTKPRTFTELVAISGFSHGINVWIGNAQELIKNGIASVSEVISSRDVIMEYLISKGLPPKDAFKIMERVRKGKGLADEDVEQMRKHDVPEWYIGSCRKISYLFPMAHATAYVLMALRIAYFKVYHPEAFYCAYFTVRADEFDADLVVQGPEYVREYMYNLKKKGSEMTARENNLLTILEVAYEAMLRGIRFLRVDLYESAADRFLITSKGLLPPLASLQGLGVNAAANIVEAREKHEFTSIEDLKSRARISSAVIEVLSKHGCLNGLTETDQLRLFG